MIRFLLFGLVFTAVMAGLNYYVYKRFFKRLHFGSFKGWAAFCLGLSFSSFRR